MTRLPAIPILSLILALAGCASRVHRTAIEPAPGPAAQPVSSADRDESRGYDALSSNDAWALAAREWGYSEAKGFPEPEPLSEDELRRISEGWTVSRALSFRLHGRTYVGGVAYQIVRASSEEVLSALLDPNHLPRALPLTLDAQPLETSGSDRLSVELLQGKAPVLARYTMNLSRPRDDALRFALDQGRPHGIADVRGYLTAQRFSHDHALVTVAVGFDLGRPWMRALLDRPVQKAALAAPAHLRRYLESGT